ncbi:hypothetical protein U2F10_24105 [Leptothoe sp. EHU-05/26/07-4]
MSLTGLLHDIDAWLENHGWCLVDNGIYTQEDWSDDDICLGLHISGAPETPEVFQVRFMQFKGVIELLDLPGIEVDSLSQFIAIAENIRLAISLIKLAESGRPQMSLIQGGIQ